MNTPTPWAVTGTGYHQAHIEDGKGNMIANCYMPGPDDTCDANAALIVRAVNSHQALIDALEGLLDVCHCDNGCAPDDMSCATNVAKAALKLAKGEA